MLLDISSVSETVFCLFFFLRCLWFSTGQAFIWTTFSEWIKVEPWSKLWKFICKFSITFVLHLLQHPVLDEPIAEAVCIIADTDKWNVQVATSQRKMMDNVKLGKDVLVSSQVSSLLQSILQLYKLNLPADFVSSFSFQ